MAITSLTQTRSGSGTTVSAVSSLSGTVFFHWYADGNYLGMSTSGSWTLFLDTDTQRRIDVVDTTDPAFDPFAAPPTGFPAFVTLFFVRSIASDVAGYRIEQIRTTFGSVATDIAFVPQGLNEWSHLVVTPRLDDLIEYDWKIYAIDRAGNENSTPLALKRRTIVRTPDAPRFSVAFDPGSTKVTFALVA